MPARVTVVLTHPIQYYSGWFRHIAAHAPQIALTVLHATEPSSEQQGVGFDRPFTWDVPLTSGYQCVTVRPSRPGDRIDSAHFFGVDVPEIGKALFETNPDVVVVPGWYSITLVRAIAACRRAGIPLMYRGDSRLASSTRGWHRVARTARTWVMLKQFDAFLSPGRAAHDYLRWFGIDESRIFNVPHAVDNDRFAAESAPFRAGPARTEARAALGIRPDAFVPLFVGKLLAIKRPADLLEAVARLGAGVVPVIVGTGPLERELRATADRLGVGAVFAGFRNQSELGRAYGIADCLILPSESETWGLVVNEALASSLPCIVSSGVGCAPDLVEDRVTGYVHATGDIDALAAAMIAIRDSRRNGHDWASACRTRIDRYRYAAMTSGLVSACHAVVNRRGSRPVAARAASVPDANEIH